MGRFLAGVVAVMVLAVCMLLPGVVAAADKAELNPHIGMKENLILNVGKRIAIKTESGDSLEGVVAKVGDHFVQIEKLSGKEFYDAVVRIDRIESVTFRAR